MPVAVEGTQVTVAFAADAEHAEHHMRKADSDEDRACVAEAIRTLTGGAKPQIAYVLGAGGRRRRGAGAPRRPTASGSSASWQSSMPRRSIQRARPA